MTARRTEAAPVRVHLEGPATTPAIDGTPCQRLPLSTVDEIFFERSGYDAAIRVCASCPLRAQCLQAALDAEAGLAVTYRHSVAGGLTPEQRVALDTKKQRRGGIH